MYNVEYSLKVKAIDLFCGIGGLSHGLVKEGIEVIAGFDIDTTCKFAYETNNNAKFYDTDVSDITEEEINALYGDCDIKILVGCAPCQPFSTYTNETKRFKDQKWALLYKFLELIEKTNPDIISMENVRQVQKHTVYDDFVKRLKELEYEVDENIVYCPDFGIPQKRTRLVLLASKKGEIKLIDKTHAEEDYVTVRDAIGNLPSINDGDIYALDPIHRTRKLSEKNKERIKQSKPGGSWRDWDEDLRLACHLKETGQSFGSVYGRMSWDEPSSTMTTQCIGIGNGRFGHPEQDRAISLREAAIFQTFPNDYQFAPDHQLINTSDIARQIGNAVPVDLGRVVGKSINKHIRELA